MRLGKVWVVLGRGPALVMSYTVVLVIFATRVKGRKAEIKIRSFLASCGQTTFLTNLCCLYSRANCPQNRWITFRLSSAIAKITTTTTHGKLIANLLHSIASITISWHWKLLECWVHSGWGVFSTILKLSIRLKSITTIHLARNPHLQNCRTTTWLNCTSWNGGTQLFCQFIQPFSSLSKWGLACNNLASQLYFLYFWWDEWKGEKNMSGHCGQLSVPRNV